MYLMKDDDGDRVIVVMVVIVMSDELIGWNELYSLVRHLLLLNAMLVRIHHQSPH